MQKTTCSILYFLSVITSWVLTRTTVSDPEYIIALLISNGWQGIPWVTTFCFFHQTQFFCPEKLHLTEWQTYIKMKTDGVHEIFSSSSINAVQTHVNAAVWPGHFLKVRDALEVQKCLFSLRRVPFLGYFWGVW